MIPHKPANYIDSFFSYFISVKPDKESKTYKRVYDDTTELLKKELESYRKSPKDLTPTKEKSEELITK